eukprot:gene3683-6497_t
MVHPSITFEVTFPENTKDDVIKTIENTIIATPHFDLETDNKTGEVQANFLTPACKWLDVVTFKILEEDEKQCKFEVRSQSTSVCCCAPWACCVSWRKAFANHQTYGDGNKNEDHIMTLLKKSKLKYETKKTGREGF